jgi:SAM-dependent methyltransferase
VISGALRGSALAEMIRDVPFLDRDAWVDALLGFDDIPPDVPLPHGAVPYLPCGVEEVLTMIDDVPLRVGDAFVDLGSGVGRVVALAYLVGGARAHGIEIQEPLVRAARERCHALGLDDITFEHADASAVELDGSIFFLYAPFNGALLSRVLERVAAVAARRTVIVCAVGLELPVPWLRARASSTSSLVIYDSVR